MGIRNSKFKGKLDFVDGEVLYDYDLDDTNNAVLNLAGSGISENAYRTLQANNIFENGDQFVVDEFTDPGGTNNTVNTGSSTAAYDSPDSTYFLASPDDSSGDTTEDPEGYTNPENAFDENDGTYASRNNPSTGGMTTHLGKTFGAKFIKSVRVYARATSVQTTLGEIKLESYDGSSWTTEETLISTSGSATYNGNIKLDKSVQGLRLYLRTSSQYSNQSHTHYVYSLEYSTEYNTSDTLLIDANTKTLDGTEESICVYADKTLPTNTNITADITDGTTTLSAQPLNEVIGLTGFTSGTLEVTFNLTTTDTSVTPTITGYGVYIK